MRPPFVLRAGRSVLDSLHSSPLCSCRHHLAPSVVAFQPHFEPRATAPSRSAGANGAHQEAGEMFQLKPIPWAVRLALLGASLGASVPALPQDQDQQDAAGADLGAVVVTDSRIARPNVESMTPVRAFGQEMFAAPGSVKLAYWPRWLPPFSPAFGFSRGRWTWWRAGGPGNSTANRGSLAWLRRVVLINGRGASSCNRS